jgi:threonine/homoserine/homoserine lactone efflux protein
MDWALLWKGIGIGFSIAAPVGPIGMLCIRRTLVGGPLAGLATGLGAATADSFYGCVAGFGLTVISQVLVAQQLWLQLVGGLFLLYLGIKTFRSRPAQLQTESTQLGLAGSYFTTLGLTLTNPMTIMSFSAVFAGLGLGLNSATGATPLWLVGGVFLGSALWWLLLSSLVGSVGKRIVGDKLIWLHRFSGVVLAGFGVAALVWR